MIFKGNANDLVGQNVAFFNDFTDIDVLNRMLVRTKDKLATDRIEISRPQRIAECFLVIDICFAHC